MYCMILSCTTPDSTIFSHRLQHHFNPLTVLTLTFRRLNPVLSQPKTCQKQKKSLETSTFQGFPLELLSRFELETSSLPTDCQPSEYRFPVLWGPFCSGKSETMVLSAPLSPPARFLLWVNLWVKRRALARWRQNLLSATWSTKSYSSRVALERLI